MPELLYYRANPLQHQSHGGDAVHARTAVELFSSLFVQYKAARLGCTRTRFVSQMVVQKCRVRRPDKGWDF
jgi:hypothetical protein